MKKQNGEQFSIYDVIWGVLNEKSMEYGQKMK
jgi:hypothetical protein